MRVKILFFFMLPLGLFGQNNWYKYQTTSYNYNTTDSVYRTGSVAISHAFDSPYNNRLMVTGNYGEVNARGQYISLNEPRFDLIDLAPLDTALVGLATDPEANYQVLTLNNYANFKSGVNFTDVHNTCLEVNYNRGIHDDLGFRDGGLLQKSATARFSGTFGHNGRAYKTTDFDIINLRLFTSSDPDNLAEVTNFYAIRLENIRGVNLGIIKNGWGIYMQPAILKNYFGGNVGIGTTDVTHALTVNAVANPVKLSGLQEGNNLTQVLSVDATGVVKKNSLSDIALDFQTTTANTTLTDGFGLYIHKGGDVIYTLPPPATRTGKIWQIVNVGSGQITTSEPFYEGDAARNTITNKAGAANYRLFSDGTMYIAI